MSELAYTVAAKRRRKQAKRVDRQAPRKIGRIEAADKRVEADADARDALRKRKLHATALQELVTRGTISSEQAAAGERLYRDWHVAGNEPRVVALYQSCPIFGDADPKQSQLDALSRFRAAIQALGIIRSPVIQHVCLTPQRGPTHWARRKNIRAAEGVRLLREGLDLLIQHYLASRNGMG